MAICYGALAFRALSASPSPTIANRVAHGNHPTWHELLLGDYSFGWIFSRGVSGYITVYAIIFAQGILVALALSEFTSASPEIFFILPLWPVVPILLLRLMCRRIVA